MSFRSERLRAKLSVEDVMQHMGVSDVAVYYWENGDTMPRADKLAKLAELYGCEIGDLLRDNPIKRSVQKTGQ